MTGKLRYIPLIFLAAASLGWGVLCLAQGQELPAETLERRNDGLLAVIIALLVLQTFLIAGLQRSRVKYKHAEENLKQSQKALEERVIERTNKLRTINNQLYDEIANHEVTEELLQETQNYLQSMINSMPSILIGVTREGTITQWNAAAEQTTDIAANDALGKRLDDVAPDFNIDQRMIHNAIDQGVTQVKEGVRHEFDGQVGYTDLVIYPLIAEEVSGAVIRIDDVTMRVRFENMMIQNEKMMSLGELAAGMAHEINNPLSAILQGVQNIQRRTSPTLPANAKTAKELDINVEDVHAYMEARGVDKFLDGIKEAGERSARIVTSMLEFSRASSRRHEPVDIVELLEHSLDLSHNSFELRTPGVSKPVQIEREFQPNLPLVPCSAVEIEQVLLNIFRNAAQSFANSDKEPVITIRAFTEGDAVNIQVADNGPGMPESTRRHIFEPFFTTKDVGQGTGLGLSVSYFIITEQHNGHIEVDSTEGEGTTFTITLPIVQP